MQNFYAFSCKMSEIVENAKQLLKLHAVRYRYLVDASDRGENCTYARITKRLFEEEKEINIVKERLLELRGIIDSLLEEIDAC